MRYHIGIRLKVDPAEKCYARLNFEGYQPDEFFSRERCTERSFLVR